MKQTVRTRQQSARGLRYLIEYLAKNTQVTLTWVTVELCIEIEQYRL